MSKDTDEVELKTELSESARYGEYANFVKIQHSGIDFRFDFAKIVPEDNTLYVHTRLFMSPIHAKLFMKALEDNIEKYEKSFGTIQLKIEKGVPITGLPSKEMH
jgi:hypothetical protein